MAGRSTKIKILFSFDTAAKVQLKLEPLFLEKSTSPTSMVNIVRRSVISEW